MGLDSDHARALSQSLHNLSVSEHLPRTARKHRRQRSASANDTFISTAVLPASDSTEILSSLINSLTILSDSAREQLRKGQAFPNPPESSPYYTSRKYPIITSGIGGGQIGRGNTSLTFDDDDIAEAPIVGYARGRPKTPNKSLRDKWTKTHSGKDRNSDSSRPSSSLTYNTSRSGTGVGVPSIKRPSTSATNRVSQETATIGEQSRKSPYKMFFSSHFSEDHITSGISSKQSEHVGPRTTRSIKDLRHLKSDNKDSPSTIVSAISISNHFHRPDSSATNGNERPRTKPSPGSSPESTRHNPLSPAHRDDLGEHLIPSRGSSLRHSPGRTSSRRKSSSTPQRPSSSGRDLKSFMVEPLPGEEDDSTIRRIRELQIARENRQSEWQKELERSKRAMKRISLPDSGPRPATLTRSSTQPVPNTEEKTSEEYAQTGLKTSKNIPDALPVLDDRDHSQSIMSTNRPLSSGVSLSRNTSSAQGGSPLAPSNVHKHGRGFSGNFRSPSSARKRDSVELRSVSEQVDAFLTAPRLTQRLRNPKTGRTIAFSEVGDPTGSVVFVCVGMGLTRYVTSFYDEIARTQKLRLITPDRPGIGESSPFGEGNNTPLTWVDDVAVICHALAIERFSLLAHSAGAIYALATALKMPQYVRGRIHLLAPWIPPSQMAASGTSNGKAANLPTSHKILSMLPAPLLRAANSRFLSATSASLESKPSRKKDRQVLASYDNLANDIANDISLPSLEFPNGRNSALSARANSPSNVNRFRSPQASPSPRNSMNSPPPLDPQARAILYNQTLTHRTWTLATTNANPATDLIVCLERRRSVGFLYRDVTRAVVIHHGRKDTRVPLENIRWLESVLQRCELRVIEDEEHGLMGSAKVMSEVISEIGQEWEEWNTIARDKERRRKLRELERNEKVKSEREKFTRTGKH